jgi:hypothetical protein
VPTWILSLVFNRYTLAALAIAAATWAAWSWHTSKIDAAVAEADRRWEARIEAERARHRGLVADWVLELAARDEAAMAKFAQAKAERVVVYRTLIEEVPRYVTPLADSRCIVPRGFVLHHDAAAVGARAAPVREVAGGLIDADSGLALSSVERTVAENYAACHDAIAEVSEWRRWYPDANASWERLRAQLASPDPKETSP